MKIGPEFVATKGLVVKGIMISGENVSLNSENDALDSVEIKVSVMDVGLDTKEATSTFQTRSSDPLVETESHSATKKVEKVSVRSAESFEVSDESLSTIVTRSSNLKYPIVIDVKLARPIVLVRLEVI